MKLKFALQASKKFYHSGKKIYGLAEPVSAIDVDGVIQMRLMIAQPYFFKAVYRSKIVGIVSAFMTSDFEIRLRGIWVDSKYRRQKIGDRLVERVISVGRSLGARYIWTMARAESSSFYERKNFKIYQTTTAFEFGPHYFAKRSID